MSPTHIVDHVKWSAIVGLPVLIIILYPPFLKRIANFGFRIIRKPPLDEMPSYSLVLTTILAYTVTGLIGGFSAFLLFNSLTPLSFSLFFPLTGSFYAAGLIGIAAFFAPAGIGVREGVLFLLLPAFIPMPIVIVGAIAMRLITTFAEVFLAALFSFLYRVSRSRNALLNERRL